MKNSAKGNRAKGRCEMCKGPIPRTNKMCSKCSAKSVALMDRVERNMRAGSRYER